MAAGRRVDGDSGQAALAAGSCVGHEKLFGMHRVLQRQIGKLQIHSDVDAPRHTQADCPKKTVHETISAICRCYPWMKSLAFSNA